MNKTQQSVNTADTGVGAMRSGELHYCPQCRFAVWSCEHRLAATPSEPPMVATPSEPSDPFSRLLWVTNHPKSIKGMWPRRIGVTYIEGPPKATAVYGRGQLSQLGLIGVYVDMSEQQYRELPIARMPSDMTQTIK